MNTWKRQIFSEQDTYEVHEHLKIEKPWNANEKISPRSLLVTEEPKRVWYALLLSLLILIFAFFPVKVVVA